VGYLLPLYPEIDSLRADTEKLRGTETFQGTSSLLSVNNSDEEETEKGETGVAHFIGTTGGLPSDAESTSLLDFVVATGVSDRCRAFLMRNSNSSFPLVRFENPLSCAVKTSKIFAASKWLS
jgi:hypothetical protein